MCAQVSGLLANYVQEDAGCSAHQDVLQRFEQLGYCASWERVCPMQVGIPMKRDRVHYQFLSKKKCSNAAAQMEELSKVWHRVATSVAYSQMHLTEFLVPDDHFSVLSASYRAMHMAQIQGNKRRREPAPPGKRGNQDELKWKKMHADLFRDTEAHVCPGLLNAAHLFHSVDLQVFAVFDALASCSPCLLRGVV